MVSFFFFCDKQAKASLEKSKAAVESAQVELSTDLKTASQAKQESERKRKNLEAQLSELNVRLQEVERARTDATEKVTKLQVSLVTRVTITTLE